MTTAPRSTLLLIAIWLAAATPLAAEIEIRPGRKPPQQDEDPIELLEETIGRMRDASQRISTNEESEQTLEKQQQIIAALQRLIEQAEQSSQEQASQNQPQQNQSPKPSSSQQQRKEQEQQSLQQQTTQQQQQEGKSSEENQQPLPSEGQRKQEQQEQALEATEKISPGQHRQERTLSKDELAKDVWGHLPPSLREELINVYSENYLPEYEELVRRYFEALAEKSQPPR